jgi:DNA mismatch endonuclease (patch repair protein)
MHRSDLMRRVKGRDTVPELLVRRLTHSLGYRFRLYRKDLPGNPDLVFPKYRRVIFVHGCFWHGHSCTRGARVPKANKEYWVSKIGRNKARDRASLRALKAIGWEALVVWECEIKDQKKLARRIQEFLSVEAINNN